MRIFKDAGGREWPLAITYGTCKRVKAALAAQQVDLLEPLLPRGVAPGTPEAQQAASHPTTALAAELLSDFTLLYDVLWAILQPEAERRQVTEDEFGEQLAGEQLFQIQQTFFDEWRDFFRGLRRPEVPAAIDKAMTFWMKAREAAAARVNSPELDAMLNTKLNEAMNSGFSSLRAFVGSPPNPEP